jgi:monofunctional biosynthetic peptidoglycan transglycosylase
MKPAKKNTRRRWLAALIIGLALMALFYFITLPDPATLRRETPHRTAFMKLREEEAQDKHKSFHITNIVVPLHDISPLAREAVRLSEDASFYEHDGFDFEEMETAAKEAVVKHRLRGASTISQQLVKNIYFSPSKNPLRKVAEAYQTQRLEHALDKDRILELYLNLVEWGDGLFGIEAASEHYFNVQAFSLAPEQAVLLAAMLPMPLKQDPRKPKRWLLKRARRLLNEMHELGKISDEEFRDAQATLDP